MGELQELSEAVNALKNNKEFTLTSLALEEREQLIEECQAFVGQKQRNQLKTIVSLLFDSVNATKQFANSHWD